MSTNSDTLTLLPDAASLVSEAQIERTQRIAHAVLREHGAMVSLIGDDLVNLADDALDLIAEVKRLRHVAVAAKQGMTRTEPLSLNRATWGTIVEASRELPAGIHRGQLATAYTGNHGYYLVTYWMGRGWCIFRNIIRVANAIAPCFADQATAARHAEHLAMIGSHPGLTLPPHPIAEEGADVHPA